MKKYFESIKLKRDKIGLLTFILAVSALIMSLVFTIYKNEKLADLFAIIFYLIFTLGAIIKLKLDIGRSF